MKNKNYELECYLEENYIDIQINPLDYVIQEEKNTAIRTAFNMLPFHLRTLLNNHIIQSNLFYTAEISRFKPKDFEDNLTEAIKLLKRAFHEEYDNVD